MKKMTVLSLVAATVLFTACGEKTKDAASSAASAVTEAVKSDTTGAMDAAKKMAADVAEKAKAKAAEIAAAAKEKAAKVAEVAKAKAEKLAAEAATKAKAAKAALAKKAEAAKVALAAKATEAANAVKEKAEVATETVTAAVASDNAIGKAAYAKCAGCHGANGTTKALGKANAVAGQTAAALSEALHGYKAGTRNVSGMGMLMKGQVASMDEATITAVAEYMSGL